MTKEELSVLRDEMTAMDTALFKLSEEGFSYVTGDEEKGFVPDGRIKTFRKRNDTLTERMS